MNFSLRLKCNARVWQTDRQTDLTKTENIRANVKLKVSWKLRQERNLISEESWAQHMTICYCDRSFAVCGATVWNSLPASLRSTDSFAASCRQLKTFLWQCDCLGAFEALAKMRGINLIIIIIILLFIIIYWQHNVSWKTTATHVHKMVQLDSSTRYTTLRLFQLFSWQQWLTDASFSISLLQYHHS